MTIYRNRPIGGYVSCLTTSAFGARIVSTYEEASHHGPGLVLGPLHPVRDEPGERSDHATKAPTVNAFWPGSQEPHLGGHRLRWYQVGHTPPPDKDVDSGRFLHQPVDNHRAPSPMPTAYKRLAAESDGGGVAPSQQLVFGLKGAPLGPLANENSGAR